jgi:RNA polymerase sigma-70 factor (ECF subfamily)
VQDELTLLAGVQKRDPQALAQVHDTYYPAIFRFVAFRVGDHETAEDLTSEVFTRLLNAVRDRNAPQNTLRGWLYRVAANVVADYHRKNYKVKHVELDESIKSNVIDPAEALSSKQLLAELSGALAELTTDQQNVISLRFGYEMAIRDVAQVMGKSEGAVKQLQARAVAALSRKMINRGES